MQSPSPSTESPTIRIEPPDPAKLAEQICAILTDETDPGKRLELLLHHTVGLVNAAGAYFFKMQGEQLETLGRLVSKQALDWSNDLASECGDLARVAMEQRRASLTPLQANDAVSVISCPVPGVKEEEYFCLGVLAVLGDHAAEPYLIVLQLLAATMVQTGSPAVPSDLLRSIIPADRFPDTQGLGTALRKWAACDIVAIGFSERGGMPKLVHISDVVSPDLKTHRSRLYQKVMHEALDREEVLVWPQQTEGLQESSLLLRELVQDTSMQQGCAVGLKTAGGGMVALILLWGGTGDRSGSIKELQGCSGLLAPLFYQTLRDEQRTGAKGAPSSSSIVKKVVGICAAALFCGWFFFYPMDFNLHPEAQIKPVQLRYVVAKFDGLIDEVFAEPGDQVKSGSELASLDEREIALELSSLEADSVKALKMRDNHHVRGEVAAAQIAQLEYQRLQERASLLTMRQSQLEIKSPTDGIVLSGDLKRRKGGPVSRGQVLFEIAPLDPVLVELGVADEDIGHLREGQEVTVRFDGFPGRSWHGQVEKIAPASKLIEGKNLFTAAFELDNSDNALQPGMRGDGSIHAGKRSPAWIYFHKPVQSLTRLLRSLF